MHDDLKRRLQDEVTTELGSRPSRDLPDVLTRGHRKRLRLRLVTTASMVLVGTALVAGGLSVGRSLTREEASPAKNSNLHPFIDTWTTTDVEGRTRTMVIRASAKDEDGYEVTVQNQTALMCSGAPSTLTGTAQHLASKLVVQSPEFTCDDGSEPKIPQDFGSPEEQFTGLAIERDPESDILTFYSPFESRFRRRDNGITYTGRTLIWGREEAENRVGDVRGLIMYGDKDGIWARDLSSPHDPSDRVQLSSASGTLIGASRDGSKLLVVRDVHDPDVGPACPACGPGSTLNNTDLFVLSSDGTETRLTDPTEGVSGGGSFSPDGSSVVYAGYGKGDPDFGDEGADAPTSIYVVDAEGGSPEVLLTPGRRRYPDEPGLIQTEVQEPKWSPDGSQIAYFDGNGDWGHSLRVMDRDGTDVRVVVENEATLGVGHVYGLEWSPDGSRLAFSIEGRLYEVGVDGSGFRLLTDDGVDPHWSPDGSHIAYTRNPEGSESGTLEVVRLEDLQVQNFGDGASGPWMADLDW